MFFLKFSVKATFTQWKCFSICAVHLHDICYKTSSRTAVHKNRTARRRLQISPLWCGRLPSGRQFSGLCSRLTALWVCWKEWTMSNHSCSCRDELTQDLLRNAVMWRITVRLIFVKVRTYRERSFFHSTEKCSGTSNEGVFCSCVSVTAYQHGRTWFTNVYENETATNCRHIERYLNCNVCA